MEYQFTRLDNGIRVISERMPQTGSLGISVLIDAGPQDEGEMQSGLAHLCEHALFLGTPQRNQQDLARTMDAAGGCFGAFTAPDYTCLYAHVLEDYGSYAFDLIGDILVASKYPEELLEREKDVVLQEIRGYSDDVDERLLQSIKQALWGDDPLSRSVLGNREEVAGLSRSDVVQFVSRQYTPDRIIVAAAGSVEHQSIVEQTQDAFWTLRGHNPPRQPVELDRPVPPVGGSLEFVSAPSSQCNFAIAIPTLDYADDRRYAMHVLNCLLGGGISSRLYQSLRDAAGLVYSIQSTLLTYRRGGALVINGVTSPENLVASVNAALSQLAGLAILELPVDEEELWKSKMQVRSQSRLASDLVSNRVASIATQEFHFGTRISPDEIVADIDALTVEDLNALASDVLLAGLGGLSLSVVGPVCESDSTYSELNELHTCYASLAAAKTTSSCGF